MVACETLPAAPAELPGIRRADRSALQVLVALAVIPTALHDPLQSAIAVARFVGIVLVEAGMHAGLAGTFAGILWRDRIGEHGVAGWG